MGFGHKIKINSNQIATEFGRVTLIKIHGKSGKAIMVASKHVSGSSFWIHPTWEYQIKSGKGYRNDYGVCVADDILEMFGVEVYDSEEHAPKVETTEPKISKEIIEKAEKAEVTDTW